MKNEIVKKDNYTRYKIAHNFKYNPKTKVRIPKGSCLFAYDFGNKLRLTQFYYDYESKGGATQFNSSCRYLTMSYKKGQLNIYKINKGNDRCTISNISSRMVMNIYGIEKLLIHPKRGENKSATKRVLKCIKRFCDRHEIPHDLKDELKGELFGPMCYPVLRDVQQFCELKPQVFNGNYTKWLRHNTTTTDFIADTFKNRGK